MKRILLALLFILLLSNIAQGESIFPVLSDEDVVAETIYAPSYGEMAGVKYDKKEDNPDGGYFIQYNNVTADNYNDFGVYLGRLSYRISGQEKQGELIAYHITNDVVEFTMVYNQKEHVMTLYYPEGVEVSAFPGYKNLNFGEEINIPSIGKFVFTEFELNKPITACDYYVTSESRTTQKLYDHYTNKQTVLTYLLFEYFNTTPEQKVYYPLNNNLFTSSLVYINFENEFLYPQVLNGKLYKNFIAMSPLKDKTTSSGFKNYHYYDHLPIEPLIKGQYAAIFRIPQEIRENEDGNIVLFLDFKSGDKYAISIR